MSVGGVVDEYIRALIECHMGFIRSSEPAKASEYFRQCMSSVAVIAKACRNCGDIEGFVKTELSKLVEKVVEFMEDVKDKPRQYAWLPRYDLSRVDYFVRNAKELLSDKDTDTIALLSRLSLLTDEVLRWSQPELIPPIKVLLDEFMNEIVVKVASSRASSIYVIME